MKTEYHWVVSGTSLYCIFW